MVVDGTTVLSQPWSGTLASYETTGVVLGSYDTSGLGAFELVIDETDENPSNSFTVELESLKPTSPAWSTSPPTRGAMKPTHRGQPRQRNRRCTCRVIRLQPGALGLTSPRDATS